MNIDFSRFRIGEKQTSGVMSVYPILGDDSSFEIASFDEISFDGTYDYGDMVFSNRSNKPFIIPSGYSIITKQEAQDHALPNAEYLKCLSDKVHFQKACCIQETQCGYIKPIKSEDFRYLPLNIRKNYLKDKIYERNSFDSFSRLWDYIYYFQQDLVKKNESNLILFFNKYMNKLANFNAEFECVEGQIGAIIMLNEDIIGIEIAPNKDYWKILWKSLIRDCYGSEVIRRIETNVIETFKDSLKLNVDYSKCSSLEEIFDTFNISMEDSRREGLKLLEDLGSIDFSNNSNKEFKDNLNYCRIYDENKVGEIFRTKNNEVVYLSLLF